MEDMMADNNPAPDAPPALKKSRSSKTAYQSLRDFMEMLEASGQLVRVTKPVSVVLEMTEIQTRLLAEGGPAVLFEKPLREDGSISPIPVLVNLFGTVRRVALGVTLQPHVPGGAEHTPTFCLLYTSPSPRDQRGSRMPSSA